jgi:hypothetical protein
MSTSTKLTLPSGVEIQLSHPEDLSTTALNLMIPQIIKTATEVIAKSGGNIVSAVVEAYETTTAKIVFYQEQGRVLREEIIPVMAKAKAYQSGRNALNSMELDDDILKEAQDELDKRRRGK